MLTQIWFIRHGEVEAPFVGTFVGRSDVALSDLGRHQAQAIGKYLEPADLAAVVTSPRTRARDTAAPLAEAVGADMVVRDGLSEMHFGQWEGLAWPAIEAKDPEFAARWQQDPANIPIPGGEAAGAFEARIHGELEQLVEEFAGRTIAVFGHAGTNRAMLSHALGIPYMETFRFAQDYGCVNAAAWHAEGHAQIALVNLVPGPPSSDHGDGGRVLE